MPRGRSLPSRFACSLLAAALLWAPLPGLRAEPPPSAAQAFEGPPSVTVADYYTRPLVRARLRVPDSLSDYRVESVLPSADDPQRYDIEVGFRARTPFGGMTAHRAQFRMRRAEGGGWIVTAH